MTGEEAQAHKTYRPYLWQGAIGLIILVVFLGGWSAIATIKGAVIASGQLVVDGKPKTIQHLDGGIVGAISVKDGDRVKAGQVLMRIDGAAIEANRSIVENRLVEVHARAARLRAERDGAPAITWPEYLTQRPSASATIAASEGEQKLFTARRNAQQSQINQLRARITQSKEQIRGFEELIASQEQQLKLVAEQLATYRKYEAKGAVSKNQILAVERENVRLRGEIASRVTDIGRMRGVISETNIQIAQIRRDAQKEILAELRTAETEISDLAEQEVAATDQSRRTEILAPVDGIVHDMQITTIGGVITAGQPIMQIIPSGDELLIQARVLPVDIDQIYVGQLALLRMTAFNQRTTPELSGRVKDISADSLVDQYTGAGYFNVRIEIPPEEREKLGDLQMLPGMPADAFIQTDGRTPLSYLLKPVTEQLGRAWREE